MGKQIEITYLLYVGFNIDVLKAGLEVAEQSIIEGNNAFAKLLKSQCLDRQEILCVRSKTDMGVKRKIELDKEIIELEHKKPRLEIIINTDENRKFCFFCYDIYSNKVVKFYIMFLLQRFSVGNSLFHFYHALNMSKIPGSFS